MLKKSLFALLSVVCGQAAYAGTVSDTLTPPCIPGQVTVPCVQKYWDIGVQALYLKPTLGKYLSYEIPSLMDYGPLDFNDGWGYRIEGSYHFNTGTDISLNLTRFDKDDDLGVKQGAYLSPTTTQVPSNYILKTDYDYSLVNLVMGQKVNMGFLQNTRFYGGLQYVKNQLTLTHHFLFDAAPNQTGGGIRTVNELAFNGVGPVIGIDYAYAIMHGLSLTANTSGALLYGTSRHQIFTDYTSHLVAQSLYASYKDVIPSVGLKLGANYQYELSQGTLNFEGGYEVVSYHALQNIYGLSGVYVGLKWLGNA